MLEISEIWICHIFDFLWVPKLTSNCSKRHTERDGDGKIYIDIIYNFYLIVHARIK